MAAIDKAAIGWSIAIVAAGVGIALAGSSGQDLGVGIQAPEPPRPSTIETTTQEESTMATDPFADIADKNREAASAQPVMEEEPMMAEEPVMEEEPMMAEEPVMEEEPMMAEEPAMEEEPMMAEEPAMEEAAPSGPQTVIVEIPVGTAVPGCEETDECYIPASVTVNAGDTVQWDNVDTAAHTVTGGSPADGPSGIFDSSLLMGNASWSFTFEEAGSYDYFCMVHPWMVGDIQVN